MLSFLIKTDKEFLINNYHRTTTNFKVDDKYDIEFIDLICDKYHNLKRVKELPKKVILLVVILVNGVGTKEFLKILNL